MKLLLLLAIALCPLRAQMLTAGIVNAPGPAAPSGPPPAPISTCHGSGQWTGSAATVTGLDCTGATLLVVYIEYFGVDTNGQVTDSSSNTWTYLTKATGWFQGTSEGRFGYVINPTVTASMSFTHSCSNAFCVLTVAGFTNTATLDVQAAGNDAGNTTTAFHTPSITTTSSGDLILVGWGIRPNDGVSAASVDTSFTILDQSTACSSCAFASNAKFASGIAYKVQPGAGAISATINFNAWSGADRENGIASFRHN